MANKAVESTVLSIGVQKAIDKDLNPIGSDSQWLFSKTKKKLLKEGHI